MQKQNKKGSETGEKNVDGQSTAGVNSAVAKRNSKAYETPTLIAYGDVRDITLGGTLGFGESGAGFENFDVFIP
ncbi:MAG: lasso RiPP family leader peptide-containing protein [Arenicella sp.]|nr:lasso RiPP family leader peptide-containing protein [Arenicella sp.]